MNRKARDEGRGTRGEGSAASRDVAHVGAASSVLTARLHVVVVLALLVFLLASIGPARVAIAKLPAWHKGQQMVLVITPDWDADHGRLQRYVYGTEGWQPVGQAWPVTIGKSGAAWGIGLSQPRQDGHPVKREGDGRSPAGVFAIGEAFGYASHADTALKYAPMHADSYCVDVSGAEYYNRIVRQSAVGAAAVKGASEHMRLDLVNNGDQRYRLGFVIEHNPAQKPMAGSCIFAHLWKKPGAPTVGCTAMAASSMKALAGWLKPASQPVFVLLPREAFQRLRKSWELPQVDMSARHSHHHSTAEPQLRRPAPFRSVGRLDVVSATPARPSVAKRHWAAHLRPLATNRGEKGGLA